MFLACGVGAFGAGIFHVFTHAFFKALLFLGSGSVILGMHHEQDMKRMGGLKKYMPITFATMFVGWLAISGVPLLSGFFSKDEILFRSFTTTALPGSWPTVLWVIGAITALLTAIYMTRLMVMTFWGKERFGSSESAPAAHSASGEDNHHGGSPRESSAIIVIPLVVLALGAALAGFLGVPEGLSGGKLPNYFEHFLEASIAHKEPVSWTAYAPISASKDHSTEFELTVVSSIIAFLGIGIGWVWFKRDPLWEPPSLLEHKYYVDEAYDAAIVQPIKQSSISILWRFIDVQIIDGAVNGAAQLAGLLGSTLRYLQSGLARSYVAVLVFGALLVIGYFVIK